MSIHRIAPALAMVTVTVGLLGAGSSAQAQSYGRSIAAGNFTGNPNANLNYSDSVVVGVPGDNYPASSAGSASVFTLSSASNNTFTAHDLLQNNLDGAGFTGATDGGSAPNDQFGYSFAVGDFDADGFKDLAVGVPFESADGAFAAGCVHVLFGAASGPLGMPFRQATAFLNRAMVYPDVVPATPTGGDQFGAALAAGDFNGDGQDDLAIGSPGVGVNGLSSAGAVFLWYSAHGTGQDVFQMNNEWTMVQGGLYSPGGSAEAYSRFGSALVAGNFDGDFSNTSGSGTGPNGRMDIKDLAVSSTGQAVNSVSGAGAVTVYYGATANLRPALVITDANPEPSETFGSALAAGDFNANCTGTFPNCGIYDDLAIGAPHKTIGGASSAGEVLVFYGTSAGLNTSASVSPAPQTWTSGSFAALSVYPVSPQANAMFGYSLATGDVLNNNENGGCQGQSCNPVELVIGEPYRNTNFGANAFAGNVYLLHGSTAGPLDLAGGATVITSFTAGALSGYSLAVGKVANNPNQNVNLVLADILIAQPGINNVLLQMGGQGVIVQQSQNRLNFPFQFP